MGWSQGTRIRLSRIQPTACGIVFRNSHLSNKNVVLKSTIVTIVWRCFHTMAQIQVANAQEVGTKLCMIGTNRSYLNSWCGQPIQSDFPFPSKSQAPAWLRDVKGVGMSMMFIVRGFCCHPNRSKQGRFSCHSLGHLSSEVEKFSVKPKRWLFFATFCNDILLYKRPQRSSLRGTSLN